MINVTAYVYRGEAFPKLSIIDGDWLQVSFSYRLECVCEVYTPLTTLGSSQFVSLTSDHAFLKLIVCQL